jgi:hypothetical protein
MASRPLTGRLTVALHLRAAGLTYEEIARHRYRDTMLYATRQGAHRAVHRAISRCLADAEQTREQGDTAALKRWVQTLTAPADLAEDLPAVLERLAEDARRKATEIRSGVPAPRAAEADR